MVAIAIGGLAYSAARPTGPAPADRHPRHHLAVKRFAKTAHDALFGQPGSDNAHHRVAVEAARLVHDLLF
jgi:hypothetical protein